MKTLVVGDIHGRRIWKDILDREQPDRVVFLGDYVASHEDISGEEQISNLLEILDLKEKNPETVFLLRGNHDMQHLSYHWAECSGYDFLVARDMPKDRFLELTQWTVVDDGLKTVFSHAGVSSVWMRNCGISDVHDINKMKPSELFGFIPNRWNDFSGDSVTQPPTWIRPFSLADCSLEGWTQVVGHTPVRNGIFDISAYEPSAGHIWLCDALHVGEYLTIVGGEFCVRGLEEMSFAKT